MGSSPFHGIFSALNHGTDDADDGVALPQEDKGKRSAAEPGKVAVDIFEQDDYYIIKAPIAGVRLADLDIEVNDNVLTVRGFRKQTDAVESDQYYLQECFYGPFSRSVTLPFPIDPRKVRATFNKECILKILVQKEEKVKIVKINEG